MARRAAVLATWLVAALAARAVPAAAQQVVRGVVFDSLVNRAPLEGATVFVQGTTLSATTDRIGRFELRGLAAGRYAIGFFHPALDTLGIAGPAQLLEVGASGQQEVRLFTPSADAVSRMFCGRPADQQSAVLFGTIAAAEDGAPLSGAIARVRWFEVEMSAAGSRQVERVASDTTGADGRYLLCDVPTDIALTLVATHDGQATGPLYLALDSIGVARRALRISRTDPAARLLPDRAPDDTTAVGRVPGRSRLRIRVRSSTGAEVPNAMVSVLGMASGELTGPDGTVLLRGIPAGSQTVTVRAIGLQPYHGLATFTPDAETTLDVQLSRFAFLLPGVAVVGQRADPLTGDIARRMRGGQGTLVEGDLLKDLSLMPSTWARIPGITVGPGADPVPLMRGQLGGRCRAEIWVDGVRMANLSGWDLRGLLLNAKRIEVYNSASRVPPEFLTVSMDPCGAVVIWSR